MTIALPAPVSAKDYLEFERTSQEKHELHDGSVLLMSGGTREHGILCANLTGLLYGQLRGKTCRMLNSEVKFAPPGTGNYYYPDAMVACPPHWTDAQNGAIDNPTVVFEVLSESTEGFDRGVKFRAYEKAPSLRAYVLASSQAPVVEVFRRLDDGLWVRSILEGIDLTLELPEVGINVSLRELYEDVGPS